MADSTVNSSVNLLGKILLEEGKYLWGAEKKVKELLEELLWMRSFLRKADAIQHKDELVLTWVNQVQNHVYESEDVIDKFIIKVVSLKHQNGCWNKMKRYFCICKEFYDLHQTASSIDSVKVKISTLSPKLKKYGLMRTLGVNTDQVEEARIEQLEQIQKNVCMQSKKIIGLEKNANEIIKALKSTSNKGFHAIYGMGGLGKTSLAKKVLEYDEVKQLFPGGQAFAYVSKQFKVENVLRDLLKSLDPNVSYANRDKNELESKLRDILKKKCLVVIDDVWTKQAWDSLKTTFTSFEGDSGSKLLLTTRKKEVAEYIDDKALQKPDPLNDSKSLQLLQETMGWDPATSLQDSTVSETLELEEKMLKVCKGLPLAIVVLGGILKRKRSVAEWKSVLNNISSYLLTGYDNGRSCMQILLESYDDLPYHLKPCFLHLAIFPEDHLIETKSLYWMWIGEGLVTRSACAVGGTKSMEDVANDCLGYLADAGLVQIVEASEGWIESIQMHDLVRDMCLEKASADNLVKAFDLREGSNDQHQINASDYYYNAKRLLRMSFTFSDNLPDDSFFEDTILSTEKAFKCIRSLIFIDCEGEDNTRDGQQLTRCICSEFQVLRVLVLAGLDGKLSSKIGKLVHLRYLSLSRTEITELPSSISKLSFLEILDLDVGSDSKMTIPNNLWKLNRLRHLLLPWTGYSIKGSGSLRIDTLVCLESIVNLQLKNLRTNDLLKIKNLRKLSISESVSKESVNDILAFLKSSHLQSCDLKVEGAVISENSELLSLIVCECNLKIRGLINLHPPENVCFSFPHHLKDLCLDRCELEYDPLAILGSLSHLENLKLCGGSYAGTEMTCSSTSFPQLRYLAFYKLKNLKVWEAEQGFMPKLESLFIGNCRDLIRIPDILPLSLQSFHFIYFYWGDDTRPENVESGAQIIQPYGSGKWLKDAVLLNEDKLVTVILGKGGAGKATKAMELYDGRDVNRSFDVVVRTWVPRSSRKKRSSCLLTRRKLQQLLRDLSRDDDDMDLTRMSCDELTAEIQQVLRRYKCLVILLNLEFDGNFDHLEAELEKMFGCRHGENGYAERGSKLVITSPFEDLAATTVPADYHLFILSPPTYFQTWNMLSGSTNSGLNWNMMRHHSGNPLSTAMFTGLVGRKENVTEWVSEHKELLSDTTPMDLSQVFTMCYDDLPLHLRQCLIHLSCFPEEAVVSTTDLYTMWIAAGFVRPEQDDDEVQSREESLQKVASTYLTELVERGMVTVTRKGPENEGPKTCQLKFALRDMCLAKAKEDQMLNTQQYLAVYLDQNSVTLSSLEYNSHLTSLLLFPFYWLKLLLFPDISDPLYSECNWEWLIYICKNFEMLRVLDIKAMRMSKGSLPVEVGDLINLRYMSLRQTWVTQLPSSVHNLTNLQALDLRVLETLVIPDVLWKLNCLLHLYLPREFSVPHPSSKLHLGGLNRLQTLVNLDTDKVFLNDLLELKLLKNLSVRKFNAMAVDELAEILTQFDTSLELCINSQIINEDPTILARKFKYLRKLKIKGIISVELNPEMFPLDLEELALKHTRLEQDPLAVLERLPKLRRLLLNRKSF